MHSQSNQRNQDSGHGPLIVGLAGAMPVQSELEILSNPLVSGVLLFSRNYESSAQLAELCKVIHGVRTPALLIFVDQEGGRIQRFAGDGFTKLPPCSALGELYDNEPEQALRLAHEIGWLMAAELRLCGIDSSLAPVVDVGGSNDTVIGDRAFHAQPQAIAKLAAAYMRGMEAAGMTGMAKHFPGHGMVPGDTHTDSCTDSRSLRQIQQHDLVPYKHLMEQGLLHAVMIAHVSYPEVDVEPAGYSRVWLRRILRQELGFSGLVVSDDLGMRAAAVVDDICDRAELSMRAGCDLLIVSESEQVAAKALRHMQLPASVNASMLDKMRGAPPGNGGQVQGRRDQVRELMQQYGFSL